MPTTERWRTALASFGDWIVHTQRRKSRRRKSSKEFKKRKKSQNHNQHHQRKNRNDLISNLKFNLIFVWLFACHSYLCSLKHWPIIFRRDLKLTMRRTPLVARILTDPCNSHQSLNFFVYFFVVWLILILYFHYVFGQLIKLLVKDLLYLVFWDRELEKVQKCMLLFKYRSHLRLFWRFDFSINLNFDFRCGTILPWKTAIEKEINTVNQSLKIVFWRRIS